MLLSRRHAGGATDAFIHTLVQPWLSGFQPSYFTLSGDPLTRTRADPRKHKKKIQTAAGLSLCNADRRDRPGSVHLEWSPQPGAAALICDGQELDCHQPVTQGAGGE